MRHTNLTDYSLLQVSGDNAEKFLQGQLTCDVSKISEQHAGLGAHCNAKGRILSLFKLFKRQQNYYLLMPTDVIETAKQHLHKYALFSKVNIAIVPLEAVDKLPFTFNPATAHQEDVKQGIPRLYPHTIGEFLPHYLNLPQFDAISFTKGCYTGQEIIARMQHRGKLKQHLYSLKLQNNYQPGEKVRYGDQNLGTCVDSIALDDERYLVLVIMQDETAKAHSELHFSLSASK